MTPRLITREEREARQNRIGLGDLVAKVAEPIARVIGVSKCGGCARRQAYLNRFTIPLVKTSKN